MSSLSDADYMCQHIITIGRKKGYICGKTIHSKGTRFGDDPYCRNHSVLFKAYNEQRQMERENERKLNEKKVSMSEEIIKNTGNIIITSSGGKVNSIVVDGIDVCGDDGFGLKDIVSEYFINLLIQKREKKNIISDVKDIKDKTTEEIIKDKEKCGICLKILKDGLCKTKCDHTFHKECLKKWNDVKHNCPICRAFIIM